MSSVWLLKPLRQDNPPWFTHVHYKNHYEGLKSLWTGVLVLLVLWVLSLFMKHISDAFLEQRYEAGVNLPEERRQMLENPITRSRIVTWGDRFKRGAFMARSSFILLLAAAIFSSLPIQRHCPPMTLDQIVLSDHAVNRLMHPGHHRAAPLHWHKKQHDKHRLTLLHSGDVNPLLNSIEPNSTNTHVHILPVKTSSRHFSDRKGHSTRDAAVPTPPIPPPSVPGDGKHGRHSPIEHPFPPSPPHVRPPGHPPKEPPNQENPEPPIVRPPNPPAPPVPPGVSRKHCYRNNVTDSVLVLSWIYVGLTLLWYVLELSLVDPRSSALTRSILGTFSYPLVIAIFAIVLSYWHY